MHRRFLRSCLTALWSAATLAGLDVRSAVAEQTVPHAVQFSIPELPAAQFLGTSPSKITRPQSAKAFTTALANGIAANGKVQQGFAIELAPVLLTDTVDLRTYQTNNAAYIWANTAISLGSIRVAGDSSATDLGLGVRSVLVDRSDLMRRKEFTDSLGGVLLTCIDAEPLAAAEACARAAAEGLRRRWTDRTWNEFSVSLAAASGWRLPESEVQGGEWIGFSGWGVAALPLCGRNRPGDPLPCRRGQWLAQLEYNDRLVNDTLDRVSSVGYGVRALFGTARLNAFLEVAGQQLIEGESELDRSTSEWSGGIEFAAGDNLWISTGFGRRFTNGASDNPVQVIANLRWNTSQGPRFKTTR